MFVTSHDHPLRGRERELSHIRDVLAHGCTEGSALLVVEGPPGVGKTRLLHACAAMAEEMGYASFEDVSAVRRTAPGPGRRARLAAGRRFPAGSAPLLILLDDADRLGREAVDVLFSRRVAVHGGRTVSVAALCRGGGSDALGAVFAMPASRREHLVLVPLAPSACAQLAADVLGAPPSPALLEWVGQAAGHPALIVALLMGLREEEALCLVDGRVHPVGTKLPQKLRAQITATMDTFSPECRHLLRMAAVLGRVLEYEVLAPMLRVSPSGLVRLLDEAVGRGLVHGDGTGTVFHSELLRRVVADSVPASLKRALQREAEEVRRSRSTTGRAR
ncbi:AAA family ATPase [Streptomyces sp. URMC 125]|uniref:AAA family ATPase n=1 Tax=Streptomyces sp. URMC 125 TaxID=3423419 RepID=UPI003F19F1B8